MELRDTFSDKNNINGLIQVFQKAIQDSEERIQAIEQDEKEGQMVWALSIGILLEIDEETFNQLVDLVKKDDPEDYLIDYLIKYRRPEWKIRLNYNFPKPYGFARKIIEEEDSEQALKLLKEYVAKKWYQGSRDTGWYNLHKTNNRSYYGYWSFESGAICKLKGLDYKQLEELPYFPYDLVAAGETEE